jgi:hypothetical protein
MALATTPETTAAVQARLRGHRRDVVGALFRGMLLLSS